jgi:dihydrofolate reductase
MAAGGWPRSGGVPNGRPSGARLDPVDPADLEQKLGVYQSAYAHIMGRATYEAMAGALPTADHPFTGIMNAARKVVFSRTLRTAEWANTTIAAGDTTEEIDKLRRGGDATSWSGAASASGGRSCGST